MKPDLLAAYPERIRYGTIHPDRMYVRVPGYYAMHHQPNEVVPAPVVFLIQEPAIAIYEGVPDAVAPGASRITPVYALGPDGSLAVPTGRVFIRFAEGVDLETRRADLEQAGYEIDERLVYAPYAAWLRPRDHDVAAALTNLSALEALPDVENVEPQLLTPPSRRFPVASDTAS